MITWLKTYINGPPVDQSKMFYTERPKGIDYQPPFGYSNMSYCPSTAHTIPGEEPFDYMLALIDKKRMNNDPGTKEFLKFEFSNWDVKGDILFTKSHKKEDDETSLRKIRLQKKKCVELNPNTGKEAFSYDIYEWLEWTDKVIPNMAHEDYPNATIEVWKEALSSWGVQRRQTENKQA